MQRHVQSRNRLHEWEMPAEVGERANHRGCQVAAPRHSVACADIGTPHSNARQARNVAAQWEGHLDRGARRQIEAMKPGGGPTREDCGRGKTPAGCRKHNAGVIGNRAQGIKAATESPPARTEQVILRKPVAPSLLKIEGTRRQSIWYPWSSRHDPPSWRRQPRNGTQPIKCNQCAEKRESTPLGFKESLQHL